MPNLYDTRLNRRPVHIVQLLRRPAKAHQPRPLVLRKPSAKLVPQVTPNVTRDTACALSHRHKLAPPNLGIRMPRVFPVVIRQRPHPAPQFAQPRARRTVIPPLSSLKIKPSSHINTNRSSRQQVVMDCPIQMPPHRQHPTFERLRQYVGAERMETPVRLLPIHHLIRESARYEQQPLKPIPILHQFHHAAQFLSRVMLIPQIPRMPLEPAHPLQTGRFFYRVPMLLFPRETRKGARRRRTAASGASGVRAPSPCPRQRCIDRHLPKIRPNAPAIFPTPRSLPWPLRSRKSCYVSATLFCNLLVINWRPHGDSNPGSHRERVVSWAGLDDGDLDAESGTLRPGSTRARLFYSGRGTGKSARASSRGGARSSRPEDRIGLPPARAPT